MNEIANHYNSFSGTDTLAFMLLPGAPPITMGALTTISYSIYRDKKPVNVMGDINVKGFTRGTRVVAGTLIFTLVNKHWINEVKDHCKWLGNFKSLKADELPLFDIMIVSANEYGSTASMFIYGVDITDESQTLSVEDMFTENQFSYIARDIDTFDSKVVGGKDVVFKSSKDFGGYDNWTITMDKKELTGTVVNDKTISEVQKKLQDLGYAIEKASGSMNQETEREIVKFQSDYGLPVTGYLDRSTEKKILDNAYEDVRPVIVSDKNGSLVYKDTTTDSDIMLQLPYSTKIVVLSKNGGWYETPQGFIREEDLVILDQDTEVYPPFLQSTVPFGTILLQENPIEGQYDIVTLLNTFEINLVLNESESVLLEVLSYYTNGSVRSMKKSYPVLPLINKEISLFDFHNLFLFDEELEEHPYMMEIFLTVKGAVYKWIVRHS